MEAVEKERERDSSSSEACTTNYHLQTSSPNTIRETQHIGD
jgi:hypothetical protein